MSLFPEALARKALQLVMLTPMTEWKQWAQADENICAIKRHISEKELIYSHLTVFLTLL